MGDGLRARCFGGILAAWVPTLFGGILAAAGCVPAVGKGPAAETSTGEEDPKGEMAARRPDARVARPAVDAFAGPSPSEAGPPGASDGTAEGRSDAASSRPDASDPERGAPDGPSSTDASTTGGPAPPCRFRFCESFETPADGAPPDPAIWRRSGDAVVVEGGAARGAKALRIRTPASPVESYISTIAALPAGTKVFYGRVFFNMRQRPTDFYHWNLVELKGTNARGPALRYGGVSTGTCAPGSFCYNTFLFQVKPQAYGGSEGATEQDDLRPLLAEKTWHCLEWFVDATTKESRFWWNGAERPKLRYDNGEPEIVFPDFVRLYLGWGLYQTGKSGVGWEVLVDELVVHDQRIGCGP